jgi:H+-transporting ATPase
MWYAFLFAIKCSCGPPALTTTQIIVGEGQVVPADAKIICDFNDPNGWEEYKLLQEQGMLDGGSDTEDEEEEKKKETAGEGTSDGQKHPADGGEEQPQQHRPRKRGYPILACDHSAITGESLAVDRYMGDVIFYTTGCKRGKAYAVVQTGAKTSFVGRTASMVQSAKGAGHFEIVMDNIGTSLLILVMAWILAAWIGGFFRHIPIASPGQQTLLHYTLSLLIIGVPVGLPVVTTTTMAVGAAYLAKKKAIVQKLTAIESLAVS